MAPLRDIPIGSRCSSALNHLLGSLLSSSLNFLFVGETLETQIVSWRRIAALINHLGFSNLAIVLFLCTELQFALRWLFLL